jgi:copper chaperone CopZ
MSCASCAHHIEKSISKMDGVSSCEVNFATETAKIEFDENIVDYTQMNATIQSLGYEFIAPVMDNMSHSGMDHSTHTGINESKESKNIEIENMRKNVRIVIPMVVFSFFYMFWDIG